MRGDWRWRAAMGAYNAAWHVARPLARSYIARRARRDPAYGAHLEEREARGAPFRADIWVHAVSLGEMRSAVPLVRALLDRGARVLTTHLTPAGRGAAEGAFGPEIAEGRLAARYMPYDMAHLWDRFLDAHQPGLALVLEIEIWPAMIATTARRGVPLWLVNAQIPDRSFPRARALARLARHPAALAAGVFAKSERHADRFRRLGAAPVIAAGELRFDQERPETLIAAGRRVRERLGPRPVVVVASAIEGEEAIYAQAALRLRGMARGARPMMVIVPRAPERFDAAHDALRSAGLGVQRRSAALDRTFGAGSAFDPEGDVLLGDSFGEMFGYLAMADVGVVGGGFVAKGAHNVIEPLSMGLPVLVGPYIWTIEYPAREAIEAGVLDVVPNGRALAEAVCGMLDDPQRLSTRQSAARAFADAHSGATARILAGLPLPKLGP